VVIDTLSNPKYVEFPVGTNKRYLDDVCYELDRETDTLTITSEGDFYNFPEERAPNLVNGFGYETIITIKNLATFLYVMFLLFSFLISILFLIGLIFVPVALYLDEIVNYYKISRCRKCGRNFAYKEIKKPLLKTVSTYYGYEETVTRYLKCKYCRDEKLNVESPQKNSKSKKRTNKKGKTCKGCGKNFALIEYRHPDVHFEYPNNFCTIKHYKCKYCGHMEISVKDDYIATS
jgi:hypothetical protein